MRQRKEIVHRLGEDIGDRRGRSRSDHGEIGPTVQETEETAVDETEVFILTAGLFGHPRQAREGEGPEHTHHPSQEPSQQDIIPIQEFGPHRGHFLEDSGTDHAAGYQQDTR